MCGIIAGTARHDLVGQLLAGLRALEYRGYDSAGLCVLNGQGFRLRRVLGRVDALSASLAADPIAGKTGIAHTRWATHGPPSERNAHPVRSGEVLALVHNGIIENHLPLRRELEGEGFRFETETDTEVIAHLIARHLLAGASLPEAVRLAVRRLEGAYAIAAISPLAPGMVVGARLGSPLLLGIGAEALYLASDAHALLGAASQIVDLEDGELAVLDGEGFRLLDFEGLSRQRHPRPIGLSLDAVERGEYRHYMQKEIHEQPQALADTLEGRIHERGALPGIFGPESEALFAQVRAVHLIACGTSHHAAAVARYWLESIAGVSAQAEIASEYRYRELVLPEGTLFVAISQSGETADTLAALRKAKALPYLARLAICNVPGSSLLRGSELSFLTRAGPEIGVASTKAFTTQLAALALLTLRLAAHRRGPGFEPRPHAEDLLRLPGLVRRTLLREAEVAALAEAFARREHALFLGRGVHYPIAQEGALKLKEISYVHAEAYAAGELKHGPLALVDENMPVVAVAPNDRLLHKLRSNLEEVRARGGQLFVFVGEGVEDVALGPRDRLIRLPDAGPFASPILFTIPLQLLAYHVAVLRGTDVDRPRNLAKSVTVE
jgi:glucosamine--fructose-6-phosphate aminotransferase (isomerizing)